MGCYVFLFGPSRCATVMSIAVVRSLTRCTTKVDECVTLVSRWGHYGAEAHTYEFGTPVTTLTEAELSRGRPGGRRATGGSHGAQRKPVAVTTALSADAGNEPRWEERHYDALRTLRGSRWTVLIYCDGPLHAEDHLAFGMGQRICDDLVKNRLTGRTKSALHLRMRCRAGDQVA